MSNSILNLPIKDFAENNIYEYKGEEDITFVQMMDKYLKAGGIFVVEDSDEKVLGYLDLTDIGKLKEILVNNKEKQ